MQNLNKKPVEFHALPRRSRFYQGAMDVDYLNKGNTFKELPESNVLFICTFDPFRQGLSKYTFRERCEENRELTLNDGTVKIFFNCKYEGDDIAEDLKKFYAYVETGQVTDTLTKRIDEAVIKGRMNEVWRTQYMREIAIIQDAKDEGREEGREEGKLSMLFILVNDKLITAKDAAEKMGITEEEFIGKMRAYMESKGE
ncbi:MAG: hypothetical protein IJ796_00050 [Lachnospiraceae bacterium]|nr:hypothetical protein [Lachnospiraceae bacterium]